MSGTNFFTKVTNASGNTEYIAFTDEFDLPSLVRGTTVPTAGTYAKGCIFIKTDAANGVKSLYENQGTTTTPSFAGVGAITEVASVTVLAAATTGTATVTAGNTVVGYYPAGNQDQFVDNVAISGTTLTVTLAAAATANNLFKVVMLK